MKNRMIVILMLFALGACKKKDITYTVEGTITDATFGQPLAGATVSLYEVPAGGATPTDLVATVVTGSDGRYSFEIKRDKIESYQIDISKNLYFGTSKSFHADDLSTKETNTFTHSVTAMSWVKLRFVNTDADQDLKYIRQEGKTGCAECCTETEQFFYGITDTSVYCINDGNTTYGYYYWVLNTANNGPMSVTTIPFDTVELVLNY